MIEVYFWPDFWWLCCLTGATGTGLCVSGETRMGETRMVQPGWTCSSEISTHAPFYRTEMVLCSLWHTYSTQTSEVCIRWLLIDLSAKLVFAIVLFSGSGLWLLWCLWCSQEHWLQIQWDTRQRVYVWLPSTSWCGEHVCLRVFLASSVHKNFLFEWLNRFVFSI